MADLAQLYVMTADLERSRRFYEQGLGLDPDRVGETTCTYATGGCELKLQADFDEDVLAEYNLDPPGTDRGDGAIVVLAVDRDVDDLHESLTTRSADSPGAALTAPRDVPWGERMFLVRDPDGYVLEVRQRDGGE